MNLISQVTVYQFLMQNHIPTQIKLYPQLNFTTAIKDTFKHYQIT